MLVVHRDTLLTRSGMWSYHSVTAEYSFDQMIEHGRRLVNGVHADGAALPLATGSVDVSYSSNVLEHVVRPTYMLSEMVRVVSPGGVVYLTFTNWLSPWGGRESIAVALPSVERGRHGAMSAFTVLRPRISTARASSVWVLVRCCAGANPDPTSRW